MPTQLGTLREDELASLEKASADQHKHQRLATEDVELDDESLELRRHPVQKLDLDSVTDPWWQDGQIWFAKYSSVAWIGAVVLGCTCILLLGLVIHFADSGGCDENPPVASLAPTPSPWKRPKNVIFMLSDGFGPASLTMARVFKNQGMLATAGERGAAMSSLNLDTIHSGHSRTYSANSFVTDSAAGATAYSCGQKTNNYQIGTDVNGNACATLLEVAKNKGMKTGMAVTSSVTDASPASFSSHVLYRNCQKDIAVQQANTRMADVMLGGGKGWYDDDMISNFTSVPGNHSLDGTFCRNKACMEGVDSVPFLGLFAEKNMAWEIDRSNNASIAAVQPSLTEMATKAVELLSADNSDGFFLFVEGSKIDKAAHPNDVASHLREILEYDNAVGAMKEWAEQDGETLIVSTSDHETGGVTLARGTMYNKDNSTAGTEAVIRVESFLNSPETPFNYAYAWYPDQLNNVTKSAELMARDAFDTVGQPWSTVVSDEVVRTQLILEAAEQVRAHSGYVLLDDEKELIEKAILTDVDSHSAHLYALRKSLGSCISRRAHIGWTTWGHTGVDVNLYSYGPGSEKLRGSMENSQVGNVIAELLDMDLAAETAKWSSDGQFHHPGASGGYSVPWPDTDLPKQAKGQPNCNSEF